jgi:hypothetical protein
MHLKNVNNILKGDKVIKLCLEPFCSGNLTHFHLEWRKSNWNRMVHERNGENQTRTERYMNGTPRANTSISPMPGGNFTNILRASFAPKAFSHKITNPNCKHIEAAQGTLV